MLLKGGNRSACHSRFDGVLPPVFGNRFARMSIISRFVSGRWPGVRMNFFRMIKERANFIEAMFLTIALSFLSLAIIGGIINFSAVPFWDMWTYITPDLYDLPSLWRP